jgi:hypothetical protein
VDDGFERAMIEAKERGDGVRRAICGRRRSGWRYGGGSGSVARGTTRSEGLGGGEGGGKWIISNESKAT